MKGRNLLLTALVMVAAGVLILLTYKSITTSGVVTVTAIVFIVASLMNVAVFAGSGKKSGSNAMGHAFGWISSAAAFVLGVTMLIFKPKFMELITFIFGVVILFGALFQIFLLVFGSRPTRLPNWLFITPILLVAAAVYVFFQTPALNDNSIMLVTGVCLLLFGVTTFVESMMIGRVNHKQLKSVKEPSIDSETVKTEPEAEKAVAVPAAGAAEEAPADRTGNDGVREA